MSCELTHARHDPAHCNAPGLFRSLRSGERRTAKLAMTHEWGEGWRAEFSGPEPLGADDLRVLQALVALAAVQGEGGRGIELNPDTGSSPGQHLRAGAELRWDATGKSLLVVSTSYRQLAVETGYARNSGGVLETIRQCIERLWKVSIIVQHGGERQGFRLLSLYAENAGGNTLLLALNPRLAAAVTGAHGYTCISMAEVRTLR